MLQGPPLGQWGETLPAASPRPWATSGQTCQGIQLGQCLPSGVMPILDSPTGCLGQTRSWKLDFAQADMWARSSQLADGGCGVSFRCSSSMGASDSSAPAMWRSLHPPPFAELVEWLGRQRIRRPGGTGVQVLPRDRRFTPRATKRRTVPARDQTETSDLHESPANTG